MMYRSLYCLYIKERRWERIDTSSANLNPPPWNTGGVLVSTGREMLYFGGTKPQEIGERGITSVRNWKDWYADLAQDACVFDTQNLTWGKCEFEVPAGI